MNSSHRRLSRGFTLIELLTVIAIIGILAGIIIPTVAAVRVSANKTKTKVQFSQWIAAMEQFKQEYGYYPAITTSQKIDPLKFAPALMAKANLKGDALSTTATSAQLGGNTKKIVFYSPASADLSSDLVNFVDSFGNTDFVLRYDANGDGKIDGTDKDNGANTGTWANVTSAASSAALNPNDADSTIATDGVRATIAIYSAGAGGSAKDIVMSWK